MTSISNGVVYLTDTMVSKCFNRLIAVQTLLSFIPLQKRFVLIQTKSQEFKTKMYKNHHTENVHLNANIFWESSNIKILQINKNIKLYLFIYKIPKASLILFSNFYLFVDSRNKHTNLQIMIYILSTLDDNISCVIKCRFGLSTFYYTKYFSLVFLKPSDFFTYFKKISNMNVEKTNTHIHELEYIMGQYNVS